MTDSDVALVLWGESCDENLAVAWVSRLRAEGRRVYLVGVSGRRIRGRYGVELTVDMNLDDALALTEQTALVVIPCEKVAMENFHRDPRFDDLLRRVGERQGEVRVVGDE